MKLYNAIKNYIPFNEQEAEDKVRILKFIDENPDFLYRENLEGHMTTSIWTVNKERTKTLIVHHNIYDSWAWTGGHADGETDLLAVALREATEETGLASIRPVTEAL